MQFLTIFAWDLYSEFDAGCLEKTRYTALKTRSLNIQRSRTFAAALTVAACGIGLWFFWQTSSADRTAAALPGARALMPIAKPASAGVQPTYLMTPADAFGAAAVRQRPAIRGSASGTTDCVALMVTFDSAMNSCKTAPDSQNCALAFIRAEGFDPGSYDMCKLFRPAN